jgi:hypothetical protein
MDNACRRHNGIHFELLIIGLVHHVYAGLPCKLPYLTEKSKFSPSSYGTSPGQIKKKCFSCRPENKGEERCRSPPNTL